MKILITGSAGFLGTYLFDELSTMSGNEVVGLSLAPYPGRVICDLTDEAAIFKIVAHYKPDVIYHLAGNSRVTDSISFDQYFFQNFLTTKYLLSACSKLGKDVAFFQASSVHVYGDQAGPVSEKSELKPQSSYAYSKFLAEKLIIAETEKPHSRVRATIARLYTCFGPGQALGFVTADFCDKLKKIPTSGGTLEVGPLTPHRRFLDVRDLAKILPKLTEGATQKGYTIYNVASPFEKTVGEMLNMLILISGKSPTVHSSSDHPNRFKGLNLDLVKLNTFIGQDFKFMPPEQTLQDMYRAIYEKDQPS